MAEMNSCTDLDISTYGTVHVQGEQSLLTLEAVGESKPLTLYSGGRNGADDEECHTMASDELLQISSKDFMYIQEVIADNLISEVPIVPESKEDLKEIDIIVQQERKVGPQKNEAVCHGSPLRSHVIREQATHSRYEPTQLPLSRDSSGRRPRSFAKNPSRVNGEMRSITQIIYKSSEVTPSTSRSHLLRAQQDDYKIKKYKKAVSSCPSNASSFRVEELPGTSGCSSGMGFNTSPPPKPPRVKQTQVVSTVAPDIMKSSQNLVHREGTVFYATTSCGTCSFEMEHKLHRPGHWPPSQCSKCGSMWAISVWKHVSSEPDDDIVFLGEFESPVPRKVNENVVYNPLSVKAEPVDERYNLPACRHCGGYHNATKGRPYDPDYCPFYSSNYGLWNQVTKH